MSLRTQRSENMIACSETFCLAFKNNANSESGNNSANFGAAVKAAFVQCCANKRINSEKINFDQQHAISKFSGLLFTIFKV